MTDIQFKKSLKKLSIIFIIVLIVIAILSIYILNGKKADISIYTNAGYVDNLQTLGMDENELKEYLTIYGNLIDNTYNEKQQTLNMACFFIEKMCSSYNVETDENGLKSYSADMVHKIATETQGAYIKDYIEDSKLYTYNAEENKYKQNEESDRIPYCIEIKDIQKSEDKIEIEYSLAIMTQEQMEEYLTGKAKEFENHNVKVTIMKNNDYEYSKYFVSSIEEIKK